ncbi:MAG: hypothetical protein Q8761_02960 [Sweet potato little leaf phytoplasma]|nr:hypothetical protein [Sweet potato little leaf phytoplasma]
MRDVLFTVDFYVVHIFIKGFPPSAASIFLGRPFVKSARTMINLNRDVLSLEHHEEIVMVYIPQVAKYPDVSASLYHVEIVDYVVQDVVVSDTIDVGLEQGTQDVDIDETGELVFYSSSDLISFDLGISITSGEMLPSVVQAPNLELKALPEHLKYAYLGKGNTLPVIISKMLTAG